MRIGIYTQPLRYNYGGLLQAYALQTVLQRMGHDVVTFDPNPYYKLPWKKKPIVYMKRLIKILLGKHCIIRLEEKNSREHDTKITFLRPFIEQHINRKVINSVSDYKTEEYDALIVGSDQVWRPIYNCTERRTLENSFLDFAEKWNVLRIAYAASFGTDKWEYNKKQTSKCAILAKKFSAISVRELSGINLCEKFLGVTAFHVLDPTMLLNTDDYNMLLEDVPYPEGDIMCYILDNNPYKESVISDIAEETNMVPFMTNAQNEGEPQPPLEAWLQGIRHSKMIITDSFHACVFSIIYHKPFIVIANEVRGNARLESLLSMFGLKNRLVREGEENPVELIQSSIDYTKVDALLDEWRQISFDFLSTNLR